MLVQNQKEQDQHLGHVHAIKSESYKSQWRIMMLKTKRVVAYNCLKKCPKKCLEILLLIVVDLEYCYIKVLASSLKMEKRGLYPKNGNEHYIKFDVAAE